MLQNFLLPLGMNFRNKLECLSLASLSSLVRCLWARPGAYSRGEHQKGVSLRLAPALPSSTILSWKGLQGANTLAYYKNL
jgi:hypothetical protein